MPDYDELDALKTRVLAAAVLLPPSILENYNRDFDITYAHESTAIEGNTLTLRETKLLLEDQISVGGKKLRELYEITNHDRAFSYARRLIKENQPFTETLFKDLHQILMEHILPGGAYRAHNVRIIGATHRPPDPYELREQIRFFFTDFPENEKKWKPIKLAAWTHAELVRIHPFADGNGRACRLAMNYVLMRAGFLPISIKTDHQAEYYAALDHYATARDLAPFTSLVAETEKSTLLDFLDSYENG